MIGRKESDMLSDPCVGLLPGSCYASALRAVSCYLEVATTGTLVYSDGCLTARYPIHLGATAGVVEVLASAFGALMKILVVVTLLMLSMHLVA